MDIPVFCRKEGTIMKLTPEKLREINNERYPLSLKYDPEWIVENAMGSHCLWLMESLLQEMSLEPEMRILDLGCGKAISSIFLAKEFGVRVWATDLWISATDNWKRICEAGVEHLVFPIQAEARALPYAEGFFDAIVGINSLQFFGTDDSYFQDHLAKLVKSRCQIGIIVPGLYHEFDGEIPDYIRPYWNPEFNSWHSPDWWRRHWDQTGLAVVEIADTLPDQEGYQLFRKFAGIVDSPDRLIPADAGRNISFVRIMARKK